MADDAVVLDLGGTEVRVTNPGKVFFPTRGETKLDLVEFYLAIGEPLMRAIGGRPLLMERYPDGARGTSFFQKRVPKGAPEWLRTVVVSTPNGTTSNALVAADLAHVVWGVNLGCLGYHVWPMRAADPAHADELRIDLDPSPGTTFEHVRAAALEVNAVLVGELVLSGEARRRVARVHGTVSVGQLRPLAGGAAFRVGLADHDRSLAQGGEAPGPQAGDHH